MAREAIRNLRFEGFDAVEIVDVGVAGPWRLFRRVVGERLARLGAQQSQGGLVEFNHDAAASHATPDSAGSPLDTGTMRRRLI
jgi:hypothetical protein